MIMGIAISFIVELFCWVFVLIGLLTSKDNTSVVSSKKGDF